MHRFESQIRTLMEQHRTSSICAVWAGYSESLSIRNEREKRLMKYFYFENDGFCHASSVEGCTEREAKVTDEICF